MVLGSVDWETARTAFLALIDWIDAPVTNIIKFGPGITPADITVQLGRDTQFGVPYSFGVGGEREPGDRVQHAPTRGGGGCRSASPAHRHRVRVRERGRHDDHDYLADVLGFESDGIAGLQSGTRTATC